MAGWFVLKKSNGKFMFNLVASNGQVILTSQRYANRAGAKAGIESVRRNCGLDERYERKTASNGQFYFSLKAQNRQVVGTSQMYKAEKNRNNGIESVKKNGSSAEVRDETA